MVWNGTSHEIRYQHQNIHLANEEAKRLAKLNPGTEFVVLHSECSYRLNELVRSEYVDDIPF